jgi:hypothetical protein
VLPEDQVQMNFLAGPLVDQFMEEAGIDSGVISRGTKGMAASGFGCSGFWCNVTAFICTRACIQNPPPPPGSLPPPRPR